MRLSSSTAAATPTSPPDGRSPAHGLSPARGRGVRQRLEALRLREEIVLAGETAREFDRVMKLLARWDRRGGAIGQREVRHLQRATFDDAMDALEKKPRNLAIPIPPLPPPPKPEGRR